MSGSKPAKELTIGRALTKKGVLAILSVLVALLVALTVLWYPEPAESEEEWFSLSQVQDGIKCTILREGYSWGYSSVEIDDGIARVAWNLGDPGQLHTQRLGDVAVRLIVVDLGGDGNMSHNDYITVTTVNSTEFKSNVLYNFTLGHGHRYISGVFIEQSFMFEDGRLVTGEQKITVIPMSILLAILYCPSSTLKCSATFLS